MGGGWDNPSVHFVTYGGRGSLGGSNLDNLINEQTLGVVGLAFNGPGPTIV